MSLERKLLAWAVAFVALMAGIATLGGPTAELPKGWPGDKTVATTVRSRSLPSASPTEKQAPRVSSGGAAVARDVAAVRDVTVARDATAVRDAAHPGLRVAAIQAQLDKLPARTDRFAASLPALREKNAELKAALVKKSAAEEGAKARGVNLGMTADEVLGSSWGRPRRVLRGPMADGDAAQWTYPGGSELYFRDGKLVKIRR